MYLDSGLSVMQSALKGDGKIPYLKYRQKSALCLKNSMTRLRQQVMKNKATSTPPLYPPDHGVFQMGRIRVDSREPPLLSCGAGT